MTTAREAAIAGVDSLLVGHSATTDLPLFSALTYATSTYTRNAGCWASDVDLTCVSVGNSYSQAATRAGTLITPRHFIYANHYLCPVGTTFRWLDSEGTLVTRTLVSQQRVGTTDMLVGKLDSDVPATITPAKILPSNWLNYFPANYITSELHGCPVLTINQSRLARVSKVVWYDGSVGEPDEAPELTFYGAAVGGDSGSPTFLIISGQPVLFMCFHLSVYGPCPHINRSALDTVLTSLGLEGNALSEVDLSDYSYTETPTPEDPDGENGATLMATIVWDGSESGDLDNALNWAGGVKPGVGDLAQIYFVNTPANWPSSGTLDSAVDVQGTSGENLAYLNGGTYNGNITADYSIIQGGTYNGTLQVSDSTGTLGMCGVCAGAGKTVTIGVNGTLELAASGCLIPGGGTFIMNGTLLITIGVIVADAGFQINGRVALSNTYCYSTTSSYVSQPAKRSPSRSTLSRTQLVSWL